MDEEEEKEEKNNNNNLFGSRSAGFSSGDRGFNTPIAV
jgi:hypothetical protein